MENKIEIFSNVEFGQMRTFTSNDGKVLFCGKDVATALGYKDTRHAITAHCKGGVKYPVLTSGGYQETTFISEGDVYRLITRSKLPSAERFESWVFDEVLPTIRKHGAYMVDSVLEQALSSPDFLIQLATQLKAEKEKNKELSDTVHEQSAKIEEMKPKYTYCEVVLACPNAISVSVIAKDYGMSARQLNSFLAEKKVQYKQGKIWLLYQKYAEFGYTITQTSTKLDSSGNPFAIVHTYWTQKGRMFIYELLKADGILPLVERQTA